jgi:3D (Asp-Asp-Asp) domain-containing protein
MKGVRMPAAGRVALLGAVLAACSTAGSTWMAEPLDADYEPLLEESARATPPPPPGSRPPSARRLGAPEAPGEPARESTPAGGRSLGTFRNTYYDFPSEADFEGPKVALMSGRCTAIASVPRGFYDAVCVQGSGTLKRGATVSFARRDCECADVCPRTSQKICFDELDAREFPWGRGATGKAITPMLTVAVDTEVIPLGTALYVPELDGLPRDPDARAAHDGCFVAQDRGLKVKGQHVDIFTGHRSLTTLWNRLVPSNRGVTVVVESPRCQRAN